MRVTELSMAEFGVVLTPADLPHADGPPRFAALPTRILESLIRFEGALAWEGGESRDAVPSMVACWAEDIWRAGWDDMYAQFGAREH